ncbi:MULTISPECIES: putative bifunctional diguanylate cyclase/phosphodiesterase [Alphaproteobacteria]|uniref:Bifunctional diguanylate cyclase/phosphodiesterase n=2 Tax=Alphaproteobacteria TaxID=28211 RepID=A0A512HKP6_9HYPH|nr:MULTISPECIES: EAL domain-containing protein [Alphaproteobacteria]GEO86022.1 bifunctional diguanylate cyclase/phosphodiesterase [Ciceribacter naphthalenivorans]GLR22109.1 bifunctional diguanylate cyclase/phosphodiesterase [Ciceribacter naphthalenivorans]GLT04965.1 bifunctional diguanylate cyclase/phosphodiesterase [Sphingomonas psychrolutea]
MRALSAKAVPADVYLSFVTSLFGNRRTLFTGMLVHILTYLTVYHKTGDPVFIVLAIAFVVVFANRIFLFARFSRAEKSTWTLEDIRHWEIRYVVGGAATAAILGIGCGYSILQFEDTFVELACIAVTMASMVSIVGRNYGSRLAVNLQSLACCLPIIVGAFFSNDPYKVLLSILLIPFVLTTQAMATGVREFLYENVIASREMKKLVGSFDTALNNMTHGLIMLDPQNRIEVINRKACELLHLGDRARLKNCDLDVVLRYGVRHTFVDGSMPSLIQRQLAQLMDGTVSRAIMQFSEDLVLEFSASRRPEGGVVLIFEDVTARIRAERRILHMARFDSLTGLPQRGYFAELVLDQIAARKKSGVVGFMVLDIDEFKHVNDMKGHVTGDRLLAAVANRLLKLAAGSVIVGHLVGDQFALFFPNVGGGADLEQKMRDVHAAIAGSYEVDGTIFAITFCAGAVLIESSELRMEEWQIKADLAVFESKSHGKGNFTAFAQEMDARYIERQRLKTDLKAAVTAGALQVVYQPMFVPDGSKIVCCEALSRWTHPEKGAIPPNIFIQIAEEMGIVTDITRFMIRKACRDCASWPEEIGVSVNLSVLDLRNDDIVKTVLEALADCGLDPKRLHLEVTESSLIEELTAVCVILEELRTHGISIAIDDFGTGFSSLSYLDSLPVDYVKIDRSFVRNIGEDARRLKLLRGIVNLSRQLDLGIIVEGVETREQLALISKYGCADLIQGYVFSMAIASDAVPELAEQAQKRPISAHPVHVA